MKKIAIIGNCQSGPLGGLLSVLCPEIKFVVPTAVHRIELAEVEEFLSSLHSFNTVITQPIVAGYRNNIGIDTDSLRSRLRPGQQLVLIPNLHFEGLFPTWGYMKYGNINLRGKMPQGSMPDCASAGVFNTLRKADYQCFFLLCAWSQGMSTSYAVTLLEKCFDSDLVRMWYSESVDEFAKREQNCDTCMTPVIRNIVSQSDFQFHSFNHPNKALLAALARQVLNIIESESTDSADLLSRLDSLRDRLEGIQLPVYPFVSSSLGVENRRKVAMRIGDSVFSVSEFVEHYFAYFECLGERGLSVNYDHRKFKLCKDLIAVN